jgi:DNA repair protein RecO (recombination protein O)
MPIRHAEAIVLRTYRVGEADKIVVFLTRQHGKIQGLAKGARRPRSKFGGSLEIGTEIELTFFEKESRELVSVDRCDIIRSGFSSSGDPILACTLAYFADLVDCFAPDREPNAKLYRLMRASVASLTGGGEPTRLTRYFEAWVLRLGGFYPTGETCSACGAKLVGEGAHYLLEEHQLCCSRCARRARNGVSLSPASLRYLEQIWHRAPGELPAPEREQVLVELAELHRRLVGQQLDKEPNSLQILEDLIRLEKKR